MKSSVILVPFSVNKNSVGEGQEEREEDAFPLTVVRLGRHGFSAWL